MKRAGFLAKHDCAVKRRTRSVPFSTGPSQTVGGPHFGHRMHPLQEAKHMLCAQRQVNLSHAHIDVDVDDVDVDVVVIAWCVCGALMFLMSILML